MTKILHIDPDLSTYHFIETLSRENDWACFQAGSLTESIAYFERESFDIIVIDLNQQDGNGIDFIMEARYQPSEPEVIVFTSSQDPELVEECMKMEAWDYICKPGNDREMEMTIQRALKYREEKDKARSRVVLNTRGIIGSTPVMMDCYQSLARVSLFDISVLITGETGTGKELFARAIHNNSDRSNQNFVVVDCTVLPENLVESVLFGHRKGAFTGAYEARKGLIAQANKGTLFLDEIGELPLEIQGAFLRVLQEKKYRPVGGTQMEQCNFRLVAATNRDLTREIEAGRFREDLLHRLRGCTIDIPPLRDHKDDIRELVLYYTGKLCDHYNLEDKTFSRDFWKVLNAYNWPGNVRELIRALESAITEAGHERILFSKHLPTSLKASSYRLQSESDQDNEVDTLLTSGGNGEFPKLKDIRSRAIAQTESRYLSRLLAETNRNIQKACEWSGLSRSRLYTLLRRYGISKTPTSK
jgi:two-component system, NtrC family, response regulator